MSVQSTASLGFTDATLITRCFRDTDLLIIWRKPEGESGKVSVRVVKTLLSLDVSADFVLPNK